LANARRPATIRRVPRPFAAEVLAVLAATCAAPPALAQSAEAAAAATDLFNAGRDRIAHGDYASACPKLAESARLDAKVGTCARLAECEEHLGHLAAAKTDWERAEKLAQATRDPRLRVVSSELARVEKRVPKLVLIVPRPYPEGIAVRLDGAAVPLDDLGAPLAVDPGDHAIDARVPGWPAWTSTVAARDDGAVTAVRIQLADPSGPRAPGADIVGSRARPSAASLPVQRPYRVGGLVTAGVGALVLTAGAIVGVAAIRKNGSSNEHGCDSATDICEQPGLGERRDAQSLGDASTWLFVGGTALVGAGIAMIVFGPRDFHAKTSGLRAPSIAPLVGPMTAGASLRAAW